ncbi:TetR/AcrR family transcriptional regulator [Brassicibacter mesophilus]|uniref:TetR/AcrR family transcriptional regulator n=1 Tax=Brassicibacter mesophilus TaxID=745119 RepID=UPI003D1FD75B
MDSKVTNNKGRIIEEASKIIMNKGVENTSLSDIAKNVGISKGTLYYYYNSKSDLISDITEKHLNRISSEMLELAENMSESMSAKDMLNLLFHKIINDETRDRLHLYLIQDALTSNSELKEKFKKDYADWREKINEGLTKVLKEKMESYETLSLIVLSILDGLIIQNLLGVENIDVNEITSFLIK